MNHKFQEQTTDKFFSFHKPLIENVFQNKVMQVLDYIGLDNKLVVLDQANTRLENHAITLLLPSTNIYEFEQLCIERQNIGPDSYGFIDRSLAVKTAFEKLGKATLIDRNNGIIQLTIEAS